MARDDIQIRVPLDYDTIKVLEQQAGAEGVPRGSRARKLMRVGLAVQRLLRNPALVGLLSEMPLKLDPENEKQVRRLLHEGLADH